jgi:hypothetical protein
MQIDRSRFLFLTASLAAAACNQPTAAITPDTGSVEPAKSEGQGTTEEKPDGVWLEIEPGTEDQPKTAGNADCDNSVGSTPPCAFTAPGGHCESFEFTQQTCRAMSEAMQPRAAEAAVNCMLAASGTWEICDWSITQKCSAAGLQATCVEPATRPECESISSQCGGSLDVFTCQQALSAVKPHRIQGVASCIREFCDLSFCVTDAGMF